VITMASVAEVAQWLADVGLNRCVAVSVHGLPAEVWLQPVAEAARTPPHSVESGTGPDRSTLLLVGHGGRRLWQHLTDDGRRQLTAADDPVDTLSTEATEQAIDRQWPDIARTLLYPHPDCPVDLVALGQVVGWQSPSPLGLGINPRYGLWSAFRALWQLGDDLESATGSGSAPGAPSLGAESPDVCADCSTHDCVAACPAGAVRVSERFNLAACSAHRARPESSCAETCLSRRSCPVGAEHRYSNDQMAYHYRITRPPVRTEPS